MTPQERELLTGLFDRLKQADRGPRDAEAERLIATEMATHPAAAYYMAQVLLVQDQALSAAQARIRQLEQQLQAARREQPDGSGSFLGGAQQSAFRPASVPPAGPWGGRSGSVLAAGAPSPAYAPQATPAAGPIAAAPTTGGAGGFLRGALQTAAGVAGGALLFEGISSLFHHGGGLFGGGGGFLPTGGSPTFIEENVINEYGNPSRPFDQAADNADPGAFPAVADGTDANPFSSPADDLATDDGADWGGTDDSDLV